MKTILWISIFLNIYCLLSCQRKKEIDVNLPPSQVQPAVECYIEPNQSLRLLLTETQDSYQSQTIPRDFYAGAFITITHSGVIDTLTFGLIVDTVSSYGKGFNYSNPRIIDYKEGEVFFLYIKTAKGAIITGKTTFTNIVPIDTVNVFFNNVNKASLRINFRDNSSVKDYYRITISKDSTGNENLANYLFDDDLFLSNEIAYNTNPNYKIGDSLQVKLYHLEKPYYDFLKSVDDAKDATGNPFAIPSQIKNTVFGGVGVFQALTYDRKKVFIYK